MCIFSEMSCYQCSSNMSFAECTEKQVTVNCASPRSYCFKQKHKRGKMTDQVEVFEKGCISKYQCNKMKANSMECCKEKLCNGGKLTFGTLKCQFV